LIPVFLLRKNGIAVIFVATAVIGKGIVCSNVLVAAGCPARWGTSSAGSCNH